MALLIKRGGKLINIFSQMQKGKILDIPAGGGKESLNLLKMGYQSFPTDLFPSATKNPALAWVQADGNEIFPFRGETFDYVLSREGIEHLENQAHFLRECARVLKPGGKLILTTPNIMCLSTRLSRLLVGHRTFRRGLANEVQTLRGMTGTKVYHGHIFLIDYFRLRYLLRMAGFGEIRVFTDKFSPTSIAFVWLVPILFISSKLAIRMYRSKAFRKTLKFPPELVLQEILSHVFSPALLFGKRMIIVAETTKC